MDELKTNYNEALTRYRKAAAYMDSGAQTDEKERHLQRFLVLMYELSGMVQQIKEAGYETTGEEIRSGFGEGFK